MAVLPIMGTIIPRGDLLVESSGAVSTTRIAASLRAALADPAVGAIVLDISSPGGAVQGVGAHLVDLDLLAVQGAALAAVFAEPEIAVGAADDAEGVIELRGSGGTGVAGETFHAGAGDGAEGGGGEWHYTEECPRNTRKTRKR